MDVERLTKLVFDRLAKVFTINIKKNTVIVCGLDRITPVLSTFKSSCEQNGGEVFKNGFCRALKRSWCAYVCRVWKPYLDLHVPPREPTGLNVFVWLIGTTGELTVWTDAVSVPGPPQSSR